MPQEQLQLDFSTMLDEYIDQENLHRTEGRKGVEALCQIARAIGYKDPQYFGQLTRKAVLGDFVMLLEDNSGLVDTIIEWIGQNGHSGWIENLKEELPLPAPEHDGQPDEAQEWHDFNPDC